MQTNTTMLRAELRNAETKRILEDINKPILKASDIPLTYRMINHWHEKNLFPFQKESGKWREFSVVDCVWVLFANRLRMLNVGLESIAKIKEQCFGSIYGLIAQSLAKYMLTGEPGEVPPIYKEGFDLFGDAETEAQMNAIEYRQFSYWLMFAIKYNADVLVRIQPNEANTTDFVLLTQEQTNTEQIVKTIAKHGGLFISIRALLNEFYNAEQFTWENLQKLEIDKEARQVIAIMREKGLKEIVVQLKDGAVNRIQAEHELKRMTLEEFNNAIVSKKYVDYRIVKNEGDELIVSYKESHVLKKSPNHQ